MSLAILFHFLCAQHVSDINICIFRSLWLCCWIITSVVLLSVRCVLEIWCAWFWVVFVLQAEAWDRNIKKKKEEEEFRRLNPLVIWRRVFWQKYIDVSQKPAVSTSLHDATWEKQYSLQSSTHEPHTTQKRISFPHLRSYHRGTEATHFTSRILLSWLLTCYIVPTCCSFPVTRSRELKPLGLSDWFATLLCNCYRFPIPKGKTGVNVRSSFFSDVMQHLMVVSYRNFRTLCL